MIIQVVLPRKLHVAEWTREAGIVQRGVYKHVFGEVGLPLEFVVAHMTGEVLLMDRHVVVVVVLIAEVSPTHVTLVRLLVHLEGIIRDFTGSQRTYWKNETPLQIPLRKRFVMLSMSNNWLLYFGNIW